MMVLTGIHGNLKTNFNPNAWKPITNLKKIMVNPHGEKCAHDKFYGKLLDYTKHYRNFGEIGVVCSIVNTKNKLDNQGMKSILLGYA